MLIPQAAVRTTTFKRPSPLCDKEKKMATVNKKIPKLEDNELREMKIVALRSMADLMFSLSERITSVGGRELSPDEKQLIRTAMVPRIKDAFNEALIGYVITGDAEELALEMANLLRE